MAYLDFLRDANLGKITATLASVLLTYVVALAVSRLYFHPLARFPGPRLAALTRWYEFYQDVILDGNFLRSYPALHKRYGPIIRVGPNHLHINDPTFFREVFRTQTPYLKAPWFYQNVGMNHSLVGICDPQEHRVQRSILNPLLSSASVTKMAPLVGEIIQHAVNIAKQRFDDGQALEIQKLYRCITVDIISACCFGHTQDLTTEDQNGVFPAFLASVDLFLRNVWFMKHFSFLGRIALQVPDWLSERLAPGYAHFRGSCARWIQEVRDRREKGIYEAKDGRVTFFDFLLEPNAAKGYQVPSMARLVDNAFLLLFAGSDTTAYALSCATYYLLTNPDCERKLKDELGAIPKRSDGLFDPKAISELPYLTAVVKESLRVSSGIPGILPRVVPPGGATVQGQFIPAGATVSSSTRLIHYNSALFPEPEVFRPERWLGDGGKALDKWMVAFSKGPRACIGINLACLEVYWTIATFFSQFDMELFETDASCMEWLDHGVAINKSYVKVKGRACTGNLGD